ncbi:hypothetical protein VFPPC_17222 [Pochonia chlamydosporia 170]|uniref:Uncharacterized protein n=1 Tax=Pochonia chlamydosporia 170 TaxID=1380566 RepID=A0A179EVN3_METCM|nr:hypothetical protein VFPPC_17222 [Pochonia chlamydosporia 170]OAQ57284.1 hypothetical protein VFPPC_17222 [Pochonia chlamydosporia 170]
MDWAKLLTAIWREDGHKLPDDMGLIEHQVINTLQDAPRNKAIGFVLIALAIAWGDLVLCDPDNLSSSTRSPEELYLISQIIPSYIPRNMARDLMVEYDKFEERAEKNHTSGSPKRGRGFGAAQARFEKDYATESQHRKAIERTQQKGKRSFALRKAEIMDSSNDTTESDDMSGRQNRLETEKRPNNSKKTLTLEQIDEELDKMEKSRVMRSRPRGVGLGHWVRWNKGQAAQSQRQNAREDSSQQNEKRKLAHKQIEKMDSSSETAESDGTSIDEKPHRVEKSRASRPGPFTDIFRKANEYARQLENEAKQKSASSSVTSFQDTSSEIEDSDRERPVKR